MMPQRWDDDKEPKRIEELRRQILDIYENRENHDWFVKREAHLQSLIRNLIHDKYVEGHLKLMRLVIVALKICLKQLRWHVNYRHWQPIVLAVLVQSMNVNNYPQRARTIAQMWTIYAELDFAKGNAGQSQTAALNALSNLDAEQHIDSVLEAVAIYLRAMPSGGQQIDTDTMLRMALQLAKKLSQPGEAAARLYHAAAYVFAERIAIRESTFYARRANALWRKGKNLEGRIEIAITIAMTAYYAGNPRSAERLLKIVEPIAVTRGNVEQVARIFHIKGNCALMQDKLSLASWCLESAIREFEMLHMRLHAGKAHHSLALTQIAASQYPSAVKSIRQTRRIWEDEKNHYGIAEVLLAKAYLYLERGSPVVAALALAQASKKREEIKDEFLKSAIASQIEQMATLVRNRGASQQFSIFGSITTP
jgi:tetratricopeptide (TPR) repeat protein